MASFTVTPAKVAFKSSQVTGERVVAKVASVAPVCKATTTCSLNTRREAMGFVALTASALVAADAKAAGPVITDFKTMNKTKGFQEIYEARELAYDNKPKGGESTRFALKKLDTAGTKARVTESGKRIADDVPGFIEKAYYPAAREELRRQCGYLRFDVNALIEQLPKESKKAAKAQAKDLITKVEALDYNLRQKDGEASTAALSDLLAAFETVKAAVV